MLASLYPKMTGFGALWRVDPVGVLLTPSVVPEAPPKTSKVHAAAAPDAISKEKDAAHKQQKQMKSRASIHDRLRAIMGDMVTEEELEQRLTFGRLLGSGATSKVYAAVDTLTGEEVAVKVFDKAAMVDVRRSMVAEGDYVQEKAVHRVRRRLVKIVSELEISRSLDHPNIIKYIGAFETTHRVCIVHELVEGCDLLEHLLAKGRMKEALAAHVFRQLLSALQYCHDRGIYHRDLKLENVLITPDMHVKLIDFGLSEVAAPGETLKTICGTPLYCSPEVLFLHSSSRKKGFFGGPADVWSVGVLIFALLTGCAPFDDSNFSRLREEVYRNAIAYPAYMSDEVKGLLKALLIFDAQLRPTVKDVLAYGWLQVGTTETAAAAAGVEKVVAVQAESEQNNPQSSCEDEIEAVSPTSDKAESVSPEWTSSSSSASPSPSPSSSKATRPRSLSSCLSENGTEGTSSTSGSFDDANAATTAKKQQQQQKVAVGAIATHLSCLEVA